MKQPDVRQHIIETASHLFYQNGYNLTGINEIIREANIAKATLYHHFKSKDDICLAYLRHKHSAFMSAFQIHISKAAPGKTRLLAIFSFLKNFFKHDDFNGCWCINTLSEIPKDKAHIRNEIKEQKQALLTVIQELVEKNHSLATKKENILLARQIYLLYEGAVVESHLHEDKWPIQSAQLLCDKILF